MILAASAAGCAVGYHGRIDSRDQKSTSVSAKFFYLDQFLAGVSVTSADVRESVDSAGRSESRVAVPVGFRVVDTDPDDIEDRWELWPFASGLFDGGAWGFEGGLHLRYRRTLYLELGAQRTFGDLGDTQGFAGFGADIGRMAKCGCLPF